MTTTIEWTEETWNPTVGCSKVSPGCDGCYAIGVAHRAMQPAHEGLTIKRAGERPDWNGEVRCLPDRLMTPLRWRRPRTVFVDSMSDLFHPAIPDEFLLQVWGTLSVSDRYAFRADHLRATPAAVRFLSLEPLMGPLPSLDLTGIDWVIVGGESGPGARPMHPDWVRDIRDRCMAAGIPFFFKQWGAVDLAYRIPGDDLHDDTLFDYEDAFDVFAVQVDGATPHRMYRDGRLAVDHQPKPDRAPWWMARMGKKAAGRQLDGRTWDEMPRRTA